MTLDSQVSIALLLGIGNIIFAGVNFFTNRKKDIKSDNEQLIRISMQLDNIQSTVTETKDDLKRINNQIIEIVRTQTIHENEIKNLWREVHELTNKDEKE